MQNIMWSHLKHLISGHVGHRPSRRRSEATRFRGQFESLEQRTVLSATIGMAAPDVVAVNIDANSITLIAIWESRPPMMDRPPLAAIGQFGDAPWENLPARSVYGAPRRAPSLDGWIDVRPPLQANAGGSSIDAAYGQVTFDNPAAEIGQPSDRPSNDEPLRIVANNPASANAGANAGANGTFGFRPDFSGPGPLAGRLSAYAAGAASYFSSLTSTTSSTASTVTMGPLETRDAVFDAYSPDSLLLAADVDGRHASNLDDGLDDDFAPDDAKSLDKLADQSLLNENVATSLDALRRERTAIDEVLAELHEVKLSPQKQSHDSTTTESGRDRDLARESDQDFFTPEAQSRTQRASSQADGGMVLLAPSGDPNSGAYDLASVYLSEIQFAGTPAFGVEASVGLYQAVDVGTRETRPAERDTLPIARPNSSAAPSASAENAPAKKSEQPS